jgi:hypothetical protein
MNIRKSAPSVLNRIEKATPNPPHEKCKINGKKGGGRKATPICHLKEVGSSVAILGYKSLFLWALWRVGVGLTRLGAGEGL